MMCFHVLTFHQVVLYTQQPTCVLLTRAPCHRLSHFQCIRMDTTVADLQLAWDKLESWFRLQRERVTIDSVLVQSHLALPGQACK